MPSAPLKHGRYTGRFDRFASQKAGSDFVEELLEVGFSVELLARKRGLSLRQFERNFHQKFGRRPREVIQEIRMSLGWERLRSGRSLKEIAAELGYHDPSNFSHAFFQFHGVAPSLVRKKMLNTPGRSV